MMSLPSGYKKVEYIESTGTQYIDTGVYPSGNSFRVVMKFRYLVSHASLSLFGNSSSRPYSITIYSTYPVFYVGDRTAFANGPQTTLDTDYELDVTASNGTLTAIWNGEEHVDTYTGSLYTGRPVFVFGANGGGFLAESDKGYRLYYFQIYNDGVLVRDLLPCINPNGEIGMYDTVEGVFYPNAGSGEFVAGAVIIDPDNPASIDFSTLQGLTIPEGAVTQITDASGRVLWSATIKFIINGDTYIADRGMTWTQWFASAYNTTGKTADDVQSISANGVTVELSAVIVGGTVYEVGFGPSEVTVTIAGSGFYSKGNDTRASVTIDGVVYNSGAVVTVPSGTVISLYTNNDSITLPDGTNGRDYTVTTDIAIGLSLVTESSGSYNFVYGAIEVVENAIAFSLTYSMMGSTYELNCFAGVDMTWNEFISSGVHDASQFAVTDGVVQYKGNPFAGILTLNYNGTAVNATDLIVPAGAYTT